MKLQVGASDHMMRLNDLDATISTRNLYKTIERANSIIQYGLLLKWQQRIGGSDIISQSSMYSKSLSWKRLEIKHLVWSVIHAVW